MSLKILRKVKDLDSSTLNALASEGGYVGNGYFDNDYPRSANLSPELLKNTECFAIATEELEIVKDGIIDLVTAEKLRESAKLSFNVKIELDDESKSSIESKSEEPAHQILDPLAEVIVLGADGEGDRE
jgi:hypothetical protein